MLNCFFKRDALSDGLLLWIKVWEKIVTGNFASMLEGVDLAAEGLEVGVDKSTLKKQLC